MRGEEFSEADRQRWGTPPSMKS